MMLCKRVPFLRSNTRHGSRTPSRTMLSLCLPVVAAAAQTVAGTVEFRIVEKSGQAVATSGDSTLDFAVQVRVTGGQSLGMFGFAVAISGESDSSGSLHTDRIMDVYGQYYTGTPETNSSVGQGGLAKQFTYLAGIDSRFNGLANSAVPGYTNTAGSQEMNGVFGAAFGTALLGTPGLDTELDGNPDTWSGNGGSTPPADGATASLNTTAASTYFAQGQFVDVYRFRYAISNLGSSRTLHLVFRQTPTAQTFSQIGFSGGVWQPVILGYVPGVTATGLDVPIYVGTYGDLNNDSAVNCADAIAAASAWGRHYPESTYRVELDYNLDGVLDVTDKAQFDSISSVASCFTQPTCASWIGGASLPSGAGTVTAAIDWDPDGTGNGGVLPRQLVVACSNGTTSTVATWNGTAWTTLASGITGTIDGLAANHNTGALYVGGEFESIGSVSANNVAVLNGTTWGALGSGTNGRIRSLYFHSAMGLVAGGDFDEADESPAAHIAAWDGTAWAEIGGGVDGVVNAVAPGTTAAPLVLGGSFTEAGGDATSAGVVGWNGSAWVSLGSGIADGAVRTIARTSTTVLVIGGNFSSVGGAGSGTANIAKWNGSAWSAMSNGLDGPVHSLWALPSSKLLAGGTFAASGTAPMNRVARWTGSDWNSLGSGVAGASSDVLGLVRLPSGELVIGGTLSIAGAAATTNFARWSDTDAPWVAVQPIKGQELVVNSSISKTVTPASGYDFAGPLTYEWKRGTTVLTDGGTISGATTATLSISSVQESDRGNYTVKVSNGCGYVVSAGSSLGTCPADYDGDGILQTADIFAFLNDWFAGCIGPSLPSGCTSSADFDESESLATADIFEFLDAWFAGCS